MVVCVVGAAGATGAVGGSGAIGATGAIGAVGAVGAVGASGEVGGVGTSIAETLLKGNAKVLARSKLVRVIFAFVNILFTFPFRLSINNLFLKLQIKSILFKLLPKI